MERTEMMLMNMPRLVPTTPVWVPRRQYSRDRWVFRVGGQAVPSRVISGAVRIDGPGEEPDNMQIAWSGDLIGLEALYPSTPTCDVRAMVGTVIEPLGPMTDPQWRALLLNALLQRRSPGTSLGRLRIGRVGNRLRRMLLLLAGQGHDQNREPVDLSVPILCELPRLIDMATIAATSVESVSRVVSNMRRAGLIEKYGDHRVRLDASLLLGDAELPQGMTRSRIGAEVRARKPVLSPAPAGLQALWPTATAAPCAA
jgi:hypothetical protein